MSRSSRGRAAPGKGRWRAKAPGRLFVRPFVCRISITICKLHTAPPPRCAVSAVGTEQAQPSATSRRLRGRPTSAHQEASRHHRQAIVRLVEAVAQVQAGAGFPSSCRSVPDKLMQAVRPMPEDRAMLRPMLPPVVGGWFRGRWGEEQLPCGPGRSPCGALMCGWAPPRSMAAHMPAMKMPLLQAQQVVGQPLDQLLPCLGAKSIVDRATQMTEQAFKVSAGSTTLGCALPLLRASQGC